MNLSTTRDTIDIFHGPPLKIISDCLRGFLTAAPGNKLIAVDLASIEARVLAWLAGQENVLEIFRGHGKLYESTASDIYGVSIDQVTKEQRLIGKVACIAEGQLVLTDSGLTPIEQVTLEQKVWDGVEWVKHDGVVYKGVKNVIEYNGLCATEGHMVFTEKGRNLPFRKCASQQIRLLQTGDGREAIRLGGNTFSACEMDWRQRQARALAEVRAYVLSVCRLWRNKVGEFIKFNKKQVQGMPALFTATTSPAVARPEGYGYEATVPKLAGPELPQLRSQGHLFQIPFRFRGLNLDQKESRTQSRTGNRSDRQQRSLRTREPAVRDSKRTDDEYQSGQDNLRTRTLDTDKKSVRNSHNSPHAASRHDAKTDSSRCEKSSERQAQELEGDQIGIKKAKVYDIVNAGPRSRFTVSNCLVHNCLALGYQGGVGAFQSMAKVYMVKISDERADDIKLKWRGANQSTVSYWYRVETAAVAAVGTPGEKFHVGQAGRHVTFMRKGSFLLCKLPSGRVIMYPYPEMRIVKTPWGEPKNALTYHGEKDHMWRRIAAYGGLIVENITQAVARDILRDAMFRWEAAGYPIVMHVHDELVSEVKKLDVRKTLKEATELMCEVPEWAKDLPISADGWEGKRYRK